MSVWEMPKSIDANIIEYIIKNDTFSESSKQRKDGRRCALQLWEAAG